MSYNKVLLMGRLTADPEMKATSEGTEYCKFTVAVDRGYSKKGEEKQTDYISCTAWRQTAVFIGKYFGKGSMILVDGEWRHDKYIKDDQTKYYDFCQVNNVSFCNSKKDEQSEPTTLNEAVDIEVDDSELPF